jgi:hypothetical protein
MSGSSRFSELISAEAGEIERRLRALEKRLNVAGARASTNARNTAENLSDAVASAIRLGRPLSSGGKYGKRSISGTRQGRGEAWNCSCESDRRRDRAASVIRAGGRGWCGDSNRHDYT